MSDIYSVIKGLEKRGAVVVGIVYEDSSTPVKNIRLGDASVRQPPYGESETTSLFVHKGRKYVRAIDHNDEESIKIFAIDKIKSLTVGGKTYKA